MTNFTRGWEFAQIAQDKWANVSDSLRTNEQLWANRSGRYLKMSECERFAQGAQCKRVNERIAQFFWVIRSFFSFAHNKRAISSKNSNKSYFLYESLGQEVIISFRQFQSNWKNPIEKCTWCSMRLECRPLDSVAVPGVVWYLSVDPWVVWLYLV